MPPTRSLATASACITSIAVRHGRRVAGADIMQNYIHIAKERVSLETEGLLRTRPMNRAVYEPSSNGNRAPRSHSPA